jgi:hypothetical protein
MTTLRRVEYAHQRRMRERNTNIYCAAHWPIWIFVFFLAPGPLVFDLFADRGNRWHIMWLIVVLIGTGIAAVRGRLPGAEPGPYILRFTEDRPNPLYRRVCYTFGWNAALNFAFMNLLGLIIAVVTGHWYMQQIYTHVYTPVLALIVLLGWQVCCRACIARPKAKVGSGVISTEPCGRLHWRRQYCLSFGRRCHVPMRPM